MDIRLKTKRLRLEPMTDEQIIALIAQEEDPQMRVAYAEMLDGCKQHPNARLWHTPWRISLRDGSMVGDLCFKGSPQNGEVEIGYGILEDHQGQGYATEAVEAAMGWAFNQPGCYFVTAETEQSNRRSQRVLEKLGFQACGEGKEGPRFEKEKPLTQWMLIYMALGMGVGAAFGASTGTVGLTLSIGMCVGLALGVALDGQEKAQRAKIKTQRIAAKDGIAPQTPEEKPR